MSSRFVLFALLSSIFFTSTLAHYPAGNQRHQHYARQMATPTFEPLNRRSSTPTIARRSALPSLARRSATPTLSRRDALQRRYEFEAHMRRRQAPSPVPSGMLGRRQAPSAVPSGLLNFRRSLPSASPLPAGMRRSATDQSAWDAMEALSRERRSFRERLDEEFYYETNAKRIKRGANPLPPRGFSLKEVGGTLRYLPDQKPSQTIKPDEANETQDAELRTAGETRFAPGLPDVGEFVTPSS
ncbi:hypothetical protein JCM16303_000976 [Sporobolomyces ruberrimus]